MRSVVRSLAAALVALSCVVLVAAAGQASVRGIQQRADGTHAGASHSLTVSITGVGPQQFADSKTTTVTASGTLTNHTGSAISGIQVQLLWYPSTFETRSAMDEFAAGGAAVLQGEQFTLVPVSGSPYQSNHALANSASTRWSASFNLPESFIADGINPRYGINSGFGVYPLRARASASSSGYVAASQTFLPYWPGKNAATPLKVAWIWPLIATPQQGACPQTLANSLAGDLSAGGRLSTLANAGLQWASKDDLTWAIDPALLSDATVMTQVYYTGGNSECTDRNRLPADPAAKTWLAKLAGTAGDAAFLTPYANVDVAALSQNGLDADLRSAYQVGDAVAAKVLPGTFGPKAGGTALAAAWPADGTADAGTLTSLARDGGVNTVVLNSTELPSSMQPFDTALARTKTSTGAGMTALLADSNVTRILGSASAGSSAGAKFAVEQDFLAQTAMIVAEGPNTSARALVVAPPAGWDPSPGEAADLLHLTRAPWLRPTSLGTLAADAANDAKLPTERLPARHVSGDELSAEYVGQLNSLDASLSLFDGMLYEPPKSYLTLLAAAAAVTQSSAWRGSGSPGGRLALTELSDYLSDLQNSVLLIPAKKVLLAGTTGDTLVSVQNGLNTLNLPDLPSLAIRVRVRATELAGGTLQVTGPSAPLVVNPGLTGSVKLHIHSATTVGTSTMQLQLTTSSGSPLTWARASEPLSVEVTRFGRMILVVIFGAIAVLVLATVVRLRRKRPGAGKHGGDRGTDTDDDSSNAESKAHAGGTG